MKKTLLIALASIAGVSAFAQGQIAIAETPYKMSVNGVEIGTTLNSYYFDVLEYVGSGTPTVTSDSSLTGTSWVDTGAYGSNGHTVPTQGEIIGATFTPVSAGAIGWSQDQPTGTAAYFVVVGWSATLAAGSAGAWSTVSSDITANFAGDSADYFVYSPVGNITAQNNGAAIGTSVWSAGGVTQALNLLPATIPEPTTMALAGLGSLGLLALRRKK